MRVMSEIVFNAEQYASWYISKRDNMFKFLLEYKIITRTSKADLTDPKPLENNTLGKVHGKEK